MRIVKVLGVAITVALVFVSAALAQSSRYYAFSGRDLRLCPSPICGGIFIKEVNRRSTTCADGTLRAECYVSGLDPSALGVGSDRAITFNNLFMQGRGIVKGTFQPLTTSFPVAGIFVLAAEEAWEAEGSVPEKGSTYLFRDNGIRCIAGPCPSIDSEQLNSGRTRQISGIDLGQTGASDAEKAFGRVSLFTTGVIASGRSSIITGPSGKALGFMASRFYFKVVQEGGACGGFAATPCPPDLFCDITMPNACSSADLSGVCKIVPQVCPLIYDPVCGCDGVTYSNDCARLAAKVQLAHAGACTGN